MRHIYDWAIIHVLFVFLMTLPAAERQGAAWPFVWAGVCFLGWVAFISWKRSRAEKGQAVQQAVAVNHGGACPCWDCAQSRGEVGDWKDEPTHWPNDPVGRFMQRRFGGVVDTKGRAA